MVNENIFAAVQEKYSIKEIAASLDIRLHRVGADYRANSIFGDGSEGRNAFAIYPIENRWYDFRDHRGGDITDLVAIVKYNGDKYKALQELMPGATSEKIKAQISQRQEFAKTVERWHNDLLNPNKPMSVRALSYLHSRKISDETIKRNKIGVMSSGAKERIVFPYFDESGKNVIYFSSRRYDWCGRGEDENEPKYMKASLTAYPFLKNSILGLNTLDRGREELIITEGHFDWQAFEQEGYSVIAPNGGDFGKLMPQVIEKIQRFKEVYLAFDNDDAGREFTYKIARELIKARIPFNVIEHNVGKDIADYYSVNGKGSLQNLLEYACTGTKWCVMYLAPKRPLKDMTIGEQDKIKKKIKSFILEITPFTDQSDMYDIISVLEGYFDKNWLTELRKDGRRGLSEVEINEQVKSHHQLMYNEKSGFYEYEDGVWKEKMNDQVGGHIAEAYGRLATGNKVETTLRLLKKDKSIWSEIPLNGFDMLPRVTFKNGTLHIDEKGNGTLKPHSSDDYTTVMLPYRFDPNAACPNIEKFLDEVTNGKKDRMLAEEFLGYLLLPDCRFQKALLLKGEGSNGKSVFINLASKMLGGTEGYVSCVEPSKIVKDFRLMPFKNSWLNISSDTENDLRGAEGVFKRIVAGENLEDSYKYKQPFSFPTRSKMIMCCNEFPTVKDVSEGFMRRFSILDFKKHFVDPDRVRPNTEDRPIDVDLEAKLLKELPGLFNLALRGLQRLLKQKGFTKTDEQDELLKNFVGENDHIVSFIENVKSEGIIYEDKGDHLEGKEIKSRDLFKYYREWAEEANYYPKTRGKFFIALRNMLKRMNIEFSENANLWQFKDINAQWSELAFDNNVIEENINESDGNVNDVVAKE